MNTKAVRNIVFTLHRYIGSAVELVAIIVGLRGSLLVFHSEISAFSSAALAALHHRVMPLEVILNQVKQTYADPDVTVQAIYSSERKH